jgi:hypothetical protein
MKIIDRLPFADRPHLVTVRGEAVDVYRNQIIVWISIDDVLKPLPAILDTGHGHNLSIGEGQLRRWSGASLNWIGEWEIGQRPVVQYAADVHLHRNVSGREALRGDSYPLEMPQGISVFEESDAPRLPLIGLRTIVANKLRPVVDGDRRHVNLTTKCWPW